MDTFEDMTQEKKQESEMHPAYFETHFRQDEQHDDWPTRFAVITAWATTGEQWSEEMNRAADQNLHSQLLETGKPVRRLTGYSPNSGHAEPGWAVAIDFDTACDIGKQFKQDAIYYVDGDDLSVSYCDERRGRVAVGSFRARMSQET